MRYFHRLLHNCKGAVLAALCCVVFYATPATAYQWNATATVDSSTMATNTLCYWAGKVLECSATNPTIASGQVGIGTSSFSQALTVAGNIDITGTGLGFLSEIANDTSTGTTANTLAKLTTSGAAIIATTSDTDGMIGIVSGGAGKTGNAQIAVNGQAQCVFDSATTAGDFVTISSTTAGDCHDAGTTRSTSSQTIGRVLTTGSAGTYPVELNLNGNASASGAASGSGTLNYVARWTPNGTTLGIGTLYDNGTSVGIGTNSPNGTFDVMDTHAAGAGGIDLISEDSVSANSNPIIFSHKVGASGGSLTELGFNVYLNSGGGTVVKNNSAGGFVINDDTRTSSTPSLNFASVTNITSTLTNVMTLTQGGNVGIGTVSPAAKLDVYGAIDISGVNGISFPADYTSDASIAIGSGALAYQTIGTSGTGAQGNTAVGFQAIGGTGLTTAAVNNTAVGYRVQTEADALSASTVGNGRREIDRGGSTPPSQSSPHILKQKNQD